VLGGDAGAVGEVVRAARADDGVELLAVIDHAAAGGTLSANGVALHELPLPYDVPSE
jgi:hypothetical protein